MAERGFSRRQFIIAGGTAAGALAGPAGRLWAASPPVRSAVLAGEDLPVAGALLSSPLASGVVADSALIDRLRDRARSLGAQLHSPVPAGTRLGYFGQPLGIVLAPERQVATAAAERLSDDLRASLAASSPPPVLHLAAALPAARSPRQAAAVDVTTEAAESAFAEAPYRLRETYHSAARLPALPAPLSVVAGAHLPLPQLIVSHPHEAGLRPSLAAWSKLPADWFRLQIASPGAESALFDIPSKLAWSASSKLRRPVELRLTPEQTRATSGLLPEVVQTLSLGADRDGRLRSLIYRVLNASPTADPSVQACGLAAQLYAPLHKQVQHQIAPLAIGPLDPDPAWSYVAGSFALESALDELASLLKLDPGRLRLLNLPPEAASGSHLQRCLARGRERLSWLEQAVTSGPQREGSFRMGQGLALGHLPLSSSGSAGPPAMGYVAHFVRLRVPDGQPALQVQRHLVVLSLPERPADLPTDRGALRDRVRRAVWSAWDRSFSPAPTYDPQTGAPLPPSSVRTPGLSDEVIEVEFVDSAEQAPAVAAGSPSGSASASAPTAAASDPSPTSVAIAALAQCGASAAWANALYSATGYRQRSLPFDLTLLPRPTPTL